MGFTHEAEVRVRVRDMADIEWVGVDSGQEVFNGDCYLKGVKFERWSE